MSSQNPRFIYRPSESMVQMLATRSLSWRSQAGVFLQVSQMSRTDSEWDLGFLFFFWTPLLYKLETRFWILCGVFSRMSHDRFILAYDTCNDKHCFTFTGFIDVVDDIVQGALWQPFWKNLCFTHPQGETPKPWDWDPFLKYPHVFWDFTTWWYSRIWSD